MRNRAALLRIGVCFAVLFASVQVYAVGPQDITNTVHNLGSSGTWKGSFYAKAPPLGTDEVCVFCHTPHNSSTELPLWNRYSSSGAGKAFLMYTSSLTLTSEVRGNTSLSVNSPSRLCLSCHDGTTALNALVNLAATGGTRPEMASDLSFAEFGFAEGEDVYLGTNLTNMHPINFNYDDAQVEDTELYLIADVKNDGLKFFEDGDGDGILESMECPTCHDPHVNYNYIQGVEIEMGGDKRYRPFLRKPNASSGLCLTCHNK